jgi:hypothetical protein
MSLFGGISWGLGSGWISGYLGGMSGSRFLGSFAIANSFHR